MSTSFIVFATSVFARSVVGIIMGEDRTLAEWNQSDAIAERVTTLINDSIRVRYLMRSDGRACLLFIDLLHDVWDEINTVSSMKDNNATYRKEIVEVESLFNELYALGDKEVRRCTRKYSESLQSVGASSAFLLRSAELKSKLLVLAQRFGFGMNIKRFSNMSEADNIRRSGR